MADIRICFFNLEENKEKELNQLLRQLRSNKNNKDILSEIELIKMDIMYKQIKKELVKKRKVIILVNIFNKK